MDKLLNFFKAVKEQSPYYNMTFAIILFFILFLPVFIGIETIDKIPELTQWRAKYLPYITICFIIFFVFGGGRFIKKVVDHFKNKKAYKKYIKERKRLLSKLENLFDQDGPKNGFKNQNECIEWSNMVVPLLQFNVQYHANFLSNAQHINFKGLSGSHYESCFNQMKSQVQMAIEELKNDLKST